jgi:DNA replication and repair protein RecF
MRLVRLEVAHVRNLSSVRIDLVDGLNLFIGANGAGKTSVLEAVHLLARGRSFRTARIGSVIERGAEALWVRADVADERQGDLMIGLQKRRDNVAEARINGLPERRQSEVAALLPLQLLLPDGADLVLGGPGERRRFLDWGMFHVKPGALTALREFQRALRQRNALLRSARGRADQLPSETSAWTDRVVELGERVSLLRNEYVEQLREHFATALARIAPDLSVAMEYLRGWSDDVDLAKSLRESSGRDVKFGATHPGPHRAELRLRVGSDAAAETLSRGQAKAVATALRLAQARFTMSAAGRRSLFLLDDVGAELDLAHSTHFFEALAEMGCQVMATATAVPEHGARFEGRRRLFHVEHGTCRRTQDED